MSPRSIRRAVERKLLKDARKVAGVTRTVETSDHAPLVPAVSQARRVANTANAQLSTGPRTAEGKAKSSVNSVRTALTGRTVLLPSDDVAAYRQHVQDFATEFQPVGPHESELVQALADHSWRLARIASLEMAIYAYGYEQFAEQFANRGELQGGFTHMHTFLHFERQIRNLQIQEMRLRRNREKDTAELRRLQQDRLEKKQDVLPVQSSEDAESLRTPPGVIQDVAEILCGPRNNGFDFSTSVVNPEWESIRRFVTPSSPESQFPERSSEPQIAA